MALSSIISVVGGSMLVAGLIVHSFGFGTPEWHVICESEVKTEKVVTAGLWQMCEKGSCKPIQQKGKALIACEASSVIAMLMAVVSLPCGLCSISLTITHKGINKKYPVVSLACTLVDAVAVFTAVFVWHRYIHDDIVSKYFRNKADLGYSFILSLIGGILIALGGNFVFEGSRMTPEQPYTRHTNLN